MGIRFTRGKYKPFKVGTVAKEIERRTSVLVSKIESDLTAAPIGFVVGTTSTWQQRSTNIAHSVVVLTTLGDVSVTPKHGTGRTLWISWLELLRDFVVTKHE